MIGRLVNDGGIDVKEIGYDVHTDPGILEFA